MSKPIKKVPVKVIEESDSESEQVQAPKVLPTKKQKVQQKVQEKQVVAKKVAKKESSDEQQDTPPVKSKKVTVPAKKVVAKKQTSSESEQESPIVKKSKVEVAKPVKKASDDIKKIPKKQESSESEEEQIVEKKIPQAKQVPVVAKTAPAKVNTKPAKKVSSSESEQSDEVPQKKVPVVVATKKVPVKVAKKETSSEEQSQEAPKPKPVAKVQAVTKKPVKKQTSSEEQSEEAPKVTKPVVTKAPVAKKPVKKQTSSEQQQEAPKKSVKPKVQEVKKVVKTQAPKVEQAKKEQVGQFQIYVGGLAYNAEEGDVQALFEQCGEVSEVRLLKQPDGRSRGIAFVKFTLQSSRAKACELDGTEQFGRPIKVQESQGRPNNKQKKPFNNASFPKKEIPENIESTTIFVGNLSYTATRESLSEHFAGVGNVKEARIATEKQTGKSRGFGYVEFYDTETVRKALELQGSELDGRNINLDVAASRKNDGGNRGGYGGNSGGYGGGRGGRGGFGANNRAGSVALTEDDKNAKKGSIGTFKGTVKKLA